jgi:energy-coupling factor transporter ATP-binding protein EcfA2
MGGGRFLDEYHVFLSYNSKDRSEAQEIVRALEARGLRVLWDRGYLKIGKPWIPALEEAIGAVKATAVLIGPDGLGRWQRREVEAALDRQVSEPDLSVIPVLLPHAHPLPRFLALNTWVDLQKGVNDVQGIDLLAAGISGETSSVEQTLQSSDAIREMVCPYRGLAAFREDDAEFFFGREAVVDQLVTALGKSRFVALVGASGSGKSSVVHAGLIPRLRQLEREEIWDFAFMKPTDRPLSALAAALFPLVEPSTTGLDKVEGINGLAEKMEQGKIELSDLIQNGRQKLAGAGRLLLIVDQWEELYTLCRDTQVRSHFIAHLHDAIERGVLSVVCTVREADQGEWFERSSVSLQQMPLKGLLRAIEEPAKMAGADFEEGLAERILEELGDEPGQLALLEFVLTELWKRRKSATLRHADYENLGGGRTLIAAHAEKVFKELDADGQEKVRQLFLLLVRSGDGTQDTRRRVALAEVGEVGSDTIRLLAGERLLTTSLAAEGSVAVGELEIAHEALITDWDRLRGWLAEDRKFLSWRERLWLARHAWQEEGRKTAYLLPRALLAEAEEWIETRRRDLTKAEENFIASSLEKHYRDLQKEAARKKAESDRRERLRRLVTRLSVRHERRSEVS